MRRCLALLLLFAMPAFAISRVQKSSLVGVSSSLTCKPNLSSSTTMNDLLVVWASWTPGSSVSASVSDQVFNSFSSAVGPTLQGNASPQISAQIFYAKKITPNTGGDNITVTFSSAATASCVAVEYSGLDPAYPLDSVSAASSLTTGFLLDSGAAAPANANLLVFGAGATDASTLVTLAAGTGFTSLVANTKSIAEEDITTSPNVTLQRAPATGDSAHLGNWVMQMAVFRDTAWTMPAGWSPVRPYQVLDGTQFSGADACARAQAAANTTINGVPTMVVDSRGEILNGIPCATPPQFATGGEWLLPAGQFKI
jgi:hypothetical protein